MKRRRRLKQVLNVVVLLLLVQVLTYAVWAPEAKGRALVLRSLGGFEGGPPAFSYIVVDSDTLNQLSRREYGGVKNLLYARGTKLVTLRADLPPENVKWHEEGGRKYMYYHDASENHWDIKFQGPFVFYASYGNYTGPLGAYGSSGVFVWILGNWFKIWSGSTEMA